VWAWGLNTSGQLGDNSMTQRLLPVRAASLTGVTHITALDAAVLGTMAEGEVMAWGEGGNGQTAQASAADLTVPSPIEILQRARVVSGGTNNVLAMDPDGTLWGWGDNLNSRLNLPEGSNPNVLTPRVILTPFKPLVFSTSGFNWMLGASDGSVWAIKGTAPVAGITLANQTWLTGDWDTDGLPTWREYLLALDPLTADTNGDGLRDGDDVANGGAAAHPDLDGDGVTNWRELAAGTNPLVADTDGDSVLDGADVFPLDPTRSALPPPTPGDTQAPIITLTRPAGAVPIP
jgi:hypothetical protein